MAKTSYPKKWDPRINERANGWNNSPVELAKIVSAINDEMYVEDESKMMEYMDAALTFIKKEYFSLEVEKSEKK